MTESSRILHPDSPPQRGEIRFNNVAFYGRVFEEYEWMFHLNAERMRGKRVLDCHGRASSFTAEAVRRGIRAVSVDPMYDHTLMALKGVGKADMEEVLLKTSSRPELYNFDFLKDFSHIRKLRETALERFFLDFPAGLAQRRYIPGELPHLPFDDNRFDYVFNNHHLFVYAEHFSYPVIHQSCREMARVCDFAHGGEVRIYPILNHNARPYQHLQKLRIDLFQKDGISAEIVEIPFQYIRGSNQLMILRQG